MSTTCRTTASRTARAAEIHASAWSSYQAKILRMNPYGSIPADNPVLNGVRSHVYPRGVFRFRAIEQAEEFRDRHRVRSEVDPRPPEPPER